MENEHLHLPLEMAQRTASIVMVMTIALLLTLARRHGGSMINGMKGNNERRDATQVKRFFILA